MQKVQFHDCTFFMFGIIGINKKAATLVAALLFIVDVFFYPSASFFACSTIFSLA
jgi:hypothetical protein